MRSRSQRKLRSKNTPRPYARLFVSAAAFASEAPLLSASFSHLMKLAGRPLSTGETFTNADFTSDAGYEAAARR
ncbi:hypothetical protein OKW35_003767 [Paraburkholderia sp. MM5477-R1]